jgi:metallo-beta-lactamase family protein
MELVKKGVNPLTFPSLITTVTAEESRELNFRKESAVVISASGMCEAGRIKHHLKHNLWRPESTIVFCGYQAGGTLGRSILDGAERVTIFSEQIDVKAEIRKLEGISAHADQAGLMKWLGCFGDKPQQIFVVHGEERVAEWFAGFVAKNLGIAAWAPEPQESFDLLAERLPVASEHPIEKPGAQELETAYNELTAALAGLDAIVARLRRHGEELTASDGVRNTLRLANAISRFAEDVESVKGKWNSQGENEN